MRVTGTGRALFLYGQHKQQFKLETRMLTANELDCFCQVPRLSCACISWNFYVYVRCIRVYVYVSTVHICACGTGSRFHNSRAGQILITLKTLIQYVHFQVISLEIFFITCSTAFCHISRNFISFSSTFPIYKTTVLFLSVFTFFIKFSIIIV